MKIKYQLVVIGNNATYKKDVVNTFLLRVEELGLEKDSAKIIDNTNFLIDYKANSPTVYLYFGKGGQLLRQFVDSNRCETGRVLFWDLLHFYRGSFCRTYFIRQILPVQFQ